MKNNGKVLFGLHQLDGIGWKTIRRLTDAFGDNLTRILDADAGDLVAIGLKPQTAAAIRNGLSFDAIDKHMEAYESRRISVITIFDADYPALLKQIAQPPWVLYVRGDIRLVHSPSIAMVGTRTPTVYGKKVAFELARELSRNGACVVSGMARGIDSCAHRGALDGKAGTAAVLGCGPDTIYPPENASLFEQVVENGVVMTEYPLGTPIRAGLFPQRNRIISGLSLGTVVVEAAVRSGSLITADQALEQSRDVFAVPGPITSPKSAGTLELIRQGAIMVTCVEHILEEYMGLSELGHTRINSEGAIDYTDGAGSEDERKVLSLLHAAPVTFDELMDASGFEFGHLHSVLLNLTLKKKIAPLPGSSYMAF